MYSVIIENEDGDQIDLMQTKDMMCVHIDGATSATATLNETENANIDGSTINSKRIDSRPINLTVRLFNNPGDCRTKLYYYAPIKKEVKLTLVNDVRSVYIKGNVKTIEADPFTNKEQMVITILCSEPYFKEINAIIEEFSNIVKMLHFVLAIDQFGVPFGEIIEEMEAEVLNVGEFDSGLEFDIKALGKVVNPKIIDIETGEYLRINYTMKYGERLLIGTINKNKYVKSVYNHIETNLISNFDLTSSWLIASIGANRYTYDADEGADKIEATVAFQNKFIGI